jgi:hypothetical protein
LLGSSEDPEKLLAGPDPGGLSAPEGNLRVHRDRAVQEWLAQHSSLIGVLYLSAYSPELNPDEGIDGDLKQRVSGATSSTTFASSRSCPGAFAASSSIGHFAMWLASRLPRPDQ